MSLLQINSINAYYGDVQALHDVSIQIEEGQIVTLIGANGAGKSTTLRTISGLIKPSLGEILFEDSIISNINPEDITRLGIVHVPEGRRIFPGLTVYENLEVATTPWYQSRNKNHQKEISDLLEKVYDIFPVLSRREKQLGWSLSGGEQQMLAIGRALMAKPRLVLLDEPSLGLAPNLVDEVFRIIYKINCQGVTILLVEQNANMALKIAQYCYVLENGRVVLSGKSRELIKSDAVRSAYLGVK